MKIKTLTLIKTLLEEEVKNASDDFDEAMSNYRIAVESLEEDLQALELERLRGIKKKANERLTASEDALDDFLEHEWK